jgi:hypothetical protein
LTDDARHVITHIDIPRFFELNATPWMILATISPALRTLIYRVKLHTQAAARHVITHIENLVS